MQLKITFIVETDNNNYEIRGYIDCDAFIKRHAERDSIGGASGGPMPPANTSSGMQSRLIDPGGEIRAKHIFSTCHVPVPKEQHSSIPSFPNQIPERSRRLLALDVPMLTVIAPR